MQKWSMWRSWCFTVLPGINDFKPSSGVTVGYEFFFNTTAYSRWGVNFILCMKMVMFVQRFVTDFAVIFLIKDNYAQKWLLFLFFYCLFSCLITGTKYFICSYLKSFFRNMIKHMKLYSNISHKTIFLKRHYEQR